MLKTRHIGLTGGIATGKSTVEAMLADLGVPVVDADALTHQLYANDGELRQQIAAEFGPTVFDNGNLTAPINRRLLGEAVFGQPERLKLLESWIHPKVIAAQKAFYTQHANAPLIVTSIPILYEKGRENDFNAVWLVYAPREVQKQRLLEKRGLTAEEAEARLNSQFDIDQKRQWANDIIDNTGDLRKTRQQLVNLLAKYQP